MIYIYIEIFIRFYWVQTTTYSSFILFDIIPFPNSCNSHAPACGGPPVLCSGGILTNLNRNLAGLELQ